jgi:hypothetical protein
MHKIGMRLVKEKKEAILGTNHGASSLEKGSKDGRDLLTLLIKANLATDLPPQQRLSDEDVLARKRKIDLV